jgi:hypothetical protein
MLQNWFKKADDWDEYDSPGPEDDSHLRDFVREGEEEKIRQKNVEIAKHNEDVLKPYVSVSSDLNDPSSNNLPVLSSLAPKVLPSDAVIPRIVASGGVYDNFWVDLDNGQTVTNQGVKELVVPAQSSSAKQLKYAINLLRFFEYFSQTLGVPSSYTGSVEEMLDEINASFNNVIQSIAEDTRAYQKEGLGPEANPLLLGIKDRLSAAVAVNEEWMRPVADRLISMGESGSFTQEDADSFIKFAREQLARHQEEEKRALEEEKRLYPLKGVMKATAVKRVNKVISDYLGSLGKTLFASENPPETKGAFLSWMPTEVSELLRAFSSANMSTTIYRSEQHYTDYEPKVPKSKTWQFEVEYLTPANSTRIVFGVIIAAGAGSVEKPLEVFDIVAYVS